MRQTQTQAYKQEQEQEQAQAQRQVLADLRRRFQAARQRTDRLFDWVDASAYTQAGIPLRHPVVFYHGHFDAFLFNTVFKRVLKQASFHPAFDDLFERGIDPASLADADVHARSDWPDRATVAAYKTEVWQHLEALFDRLLVDDGALVASARLPLLQQALWMAYEHELMHQETLLYIIHQFPHAHKRPPESYTLPVAGPVPDVTFQPVPAGLAMLGAEPGDFPFVWDNEQWATAVAVEAFSMQTHPVTHAEFLDFVTAGGYQTPSLWSESAWAWVQTAGVEGQPKTHPHQWFQAADGTWQLRSLFEDLPLPLSWPVYVTHAEAEAYCRFVGRRLPTEAEWHRAAYGDHADWRYPGGAVSPEAVGGGGHLNFTGWTPVPVGSAEQPANPYGLKDMHGNGWAWTATPFAPLPGFEPSPLYEPYSQDFFDGAHYVVCGGSPFTDAQLTRRSFRNWFYWHYPYTYTGFRTVQ
ncbi:MAG: SUMF1/EgtB/PvdO family nonheme iron enzyme [Cyanobacteria bacterium HKST-UBA04]|nr:SUMF1/EgtB/PvdO family nonheme iron enzyme [Cyanobacteria bacterium HKST-UBA04]